MRRAGRSRAPLLPFQDGQSSTDFRERAEQDSRADDTASTRRALRAVGEGPCLPLSLLPRISTGQKLTTLAQCQTCFPSTEDKARLAKTLQISDRKVQVSSLYLAFREIRAVVAIGSIEKEESDDHDGVIEDLNR